MKQYLLDGIKQAEEIIFTRGIELANEKDEYIKGVIQDSIDRYRKLVAINKELLEHERYNPK
jgi:hypothetical protein